MLRPEQLTSSARRVFEHLTQEEALRGFTLIGGTALALQIGHRRSEDLDFWLPGESLDKGVISALIRRVQNAGLPAMLATPHQRIVAARINGFDLLSRAQDYVIAGVKVTFFARHDVAYRYFDAEPRLRKEVSVFRFAPRCILCQPMGGSDGRHGGSVDSRSLASGGRL